MSLSRVVVHFRCASIRETPMPKYVLRINGDTPLGAPRYVQTFTDVDKVVLTPRLEQALRWNSIAEVVTSLEHRSYCCGQSGRWFGRATLELCRVATTPGAERFAIKQVTSGGVQYVDYFSSEGSFNFAAALAKAYPFKTEGDAYRAIARRVDRFPAFRDDLRVMPVAGIPVESVEVVV